jgi:hypothetical protein
MKEIKRKIQIKIEIKHVNVYTYIHNMALTRREESGVSGTVTSKGGGGMFSHINKSNV